MFEPSTVVTFGGLLALITLATATFKAVGWFRGIVEKAVDDIKAQMEKDLKVIHERIDRANAETKEIRREYVLRVDMGSHLNSFDKKLDGVITQINGLQKMLIRQGSVGDRQ